MSLSASDYSDFTRIMALYKLYYLLTYLLTYLLIVSRLNYTVTGLIKRFIMTIRSYKRNRLDFGGRADSFVDPADHFPGFFTVSR